MKFKCRYCWKIIEKDYEIKRSYCEKYNKRTNLIKL